MTADVELSGGDADLAELVGRRPRPLVRFRPSQSDLGRALGLRPEAPGATEVAVDALVIDERRRPSAVNAVILGCSPDRLSWMARAVSLSVVIDDRTWFRGRATTVVVASGQFLRGVDVSPRGHPGDGWAEVQVYELRRGERRAMRRRLPTGTHVPHPRIRTGRARRVDIALGGQGLPLEIDGRAQGGVTRLAVAVVPAALRLLV